MPDDIAYTIPAPFTDAARLFVERVARAVHAGAWLSDSALQEWHEAIARARVLAALESARAVSAQIGAQQFRREEAFSLDTAWDQPFAAMIEAYLRRYPEVMLSAGQLERIYLEDGADVAEAAAAELYRGIRETQLRAMRDGIPIASAIDLMEEALPRSRAYWETVYQTTSAQAYTDGQRAQAMATDAVIGFVIVTTKDRATRPNHRAYEGWAVPKGSSLLDVHSPPFGFRCRCRAVPITAAVARRRGIELTDAGQIAPTPPPPGARPDEGFK